MNTSVQDQNQEQDHDRDEDQSQASMRHFSRIIELYAKKKGVHLDQQQLSDALKDWQASSTPLSPKDALRQLQSIGKRLGWKNLHALKKSEINNARIPPVFPILAYSTIEGWLLIEHRNALGQWQVQSQAGLQLLDTSQIESCQFFSIAISKRGSLESAAQMIRTHFFAYRSIFLEGALATLMINALAVAASFYSMQIYDRVIPTQGYSSLLFLSLGVALCIAFELILKILRSYVMEHAVVGLDAKMSRDIFLRLLGLRLDQLPPHLGSLAGQLRAYEGIRALLTSSTIYLLVDLPFALVFILIIALIGTPVLLWIPFVFFTSCILIGLVLKHRIQTQARLASQAGNQKTGLLVEAIEGAETIKSGGGQWRFLTRWLQLHADSILADLKLRQSGELGGYLTVSLQQLAYAALVALGAWQVMEGQMSMGALIACTMLSSRALAPAGMICSLLVQVAHAKAALDGLDKIYSLQADNHAIEKPLLPQQIRGAYKIEALKYQYPSNQLNQQHHQQSNHPNSATSALALNIPQWTIPAGRRVGVLGAVGVGKSTLLKLLAGLYLPSDGRILLDDLELSHISRPLLSEQIAYLQQEHRLFQGSLRDNLLIGLPDPGDTRLLEVCRQTGLIQMIAGHPLGLDLSISEGGKGLSGGQKQLLALTRLFLAQPKIWLLDEPTAHLDDELERRCILMLAQTFIQAQTVVIVTHKPALLALVDHLMVLGAQGVLLEGPRDEVLLKLRQVTQQKPPALPASSPLPSNPAA